MDGRVRTGDACETAAGRDGERFEKKAAALGFADDQKGDTPSDRLRLTLRTLRSGGEWLRLKLENAWALTSRCSDT